jgi:hypothetical protein
LRRAVFTGAALVCQLEARLLARFDHPSLVKVLRYWEASNTAYVAGPCYAGSNLHAVRRRMAQPPDDAWRRVLLEPLLGALDRLRGETVPAAPPPAITANKTPVVTQPRPADRDAEPVLLQARALSPAKRCEGRALAALSACIERHCKAEPGLRDHPDCARSRREVEQRTAP